MRRKICAIGNSRGVSLPIEALEKLKLAVGSEVDVVIDEENGRIVIEPVRKVAFPEGIDADFAAQVNDFIEQYRPALKKLAE
jgi:putative addiction module antidote